MWRGCLIDGADRPVRGDPFAGGSAKTVLSWTRRAVSSIEVVCTVAISYWLRVFRTISSPLDGLAHTVEAAWERRTWPIDICQLSL
jgi:hypothetical protein